MATEETDEMCPRCRCCEMDRDECEDCGGEGHVETGEMYDWDPLAGSIEDCRTCEGQGGWTVCGGHCGPTGQHDKKTLDLFGHRASQDSGGGE